MTGDITYHLVTAKTSHILLRRRTNVSVCLIPKQNFKMENSEKMLLIFLFLLILLLIPEGKVPLLCRKILWVFVDRRNISLLVESVYKGFKTIPKVSLIHVNKGNLHDHYHA